MITVLEHYIDGFISAEQISQAKEHLLILIPLQELILGAEHPDTAESKHKLNSL